MDKVQNAIVRLRHASLKTSFDGVYRASIIGGDVSALTGGS